MDESKSSSPTDAVQTFVDTGEIVWTSEFIRACRGVSSPDVPSIDVAVARYLRIHNNAEKRALARSEGIAMDSDTWESLSNMDAFRKGILWRFEDPWTKLINFAQFGCLEAVRYIVETHKDKITQRDLDCAIDLACIQGHLVVIQYLHGVGGDVYGAAGFSFVRAALGGHVHVLEYLLSQLDTTKCEAKSILTRALSTASMGRLDAAKWLLARGADVNGEGGRGGPLRLAISGGHENIVRLLLSHSPNLAAVDPSTKFDLLDHAIANDRWVCAKLLLDNGARFDATRQQIMTDDVSPDTLLRVVTLLVETGADTPTLDLLRARAVERGATQVVAYLDSQPAESS